MLTQDQFAELMRDTVKLEQQVWGESWKDKMPYTILGVNKLTSVLLEPFEGEKHDAMVLCQVLNAVFLEFLSWKGETVENLSLAFAISAASPIIIHDKKFNPENLELHPAVVHFSLGVFNLTPSMALFSFIWNSLCKNEDLFTTYKLYYTPTKQL